METSVFTFAVVFLILNSTVTLSSSTPILNSTTDLDALLAFKAAITSDPLGVLSSSWSSNTSACYWTGVSCSLDRVTALNLSGLKLHGTLAPHLGNLTFLQLLDISSNNFTGSIPSQLSLLQHMTTLNVYENQFTSVGGSIFTNMSSLIEIDMSFNKLSGELPDDMCRNTPELQRIYLSENQLSGRIPASLNECRKLEKLRLSVNQFSGSMPSEIGKLTMLTELDIYSNHLEGSIPPFIFNISAMEYVDLSENSLNGSLPAFNSLPYLEYLYLNDNKFTGGIPKEIGLLPSLEDLFLFNNHLTGGIPKEIGVLPSVKRIKLYKNELTGQIPKQIGNLSLLETLDLALNKLGGELPEELGNLANINVLDAGFNDFLNGSIPASIFNLSTLTKLALQQNHLSGTLPSTMGFSLSNLEELYLYWNLLSGAIPSSIINASKLTVLELNNNSFTGSIPDFGSLRLLQTLRLWLNNLTSGEESPTQELGFLTSLTNCPDLKYLEISYNPMMNGVLPTSVGNLSTSLINFEAAGCGIGGAIPSELGNLSSLQVIDLSDNKLNGFIPTTVGRLKQLGKLYLYDNRLQGYIPHELCQMSNLLDLQLMQNMLTGSIPACLGEVKSLRGVLLSSNNLNSTLPSNFFNLPDLITLQLSFNNLSGQIPNDIRELKMINFLDLSSNKFSGYIPDSFDSLTSLEHLNLSNNQFNGYIPDSFVELKGLKELDLSNNHLSGFIPKSLVKLDLGFFNVSLNQLEGEILDEGSFQKLGAQSFLNNYHLCGPARFQVPPCSQGSKKRSVSRLMLYIVPPILAVMALVVGILVLVRRCRPEKPPPIEDLSLSVGWRLISEREIRKGTSSFSEMNLLGKGGMGSVFKAKLADEAEVAVKVFNLQVEGATKSFETESRILSSIRHRNLVKILGCCSNLDFKALILAYMPNGSLDKWLHSDKLCLDLVQRLKIALDVALALEYLHHHHTFPVVHCDVKPNNVLLDADMTAHVADFGIAKLIHSDEAVVHTKNMATIGYAAPELGEGKITTSGDVYSYGILLLEMFTGKRPTDEMFDTEMSMKEWVEKALKEDGISEVVAPGLVSREDPYVYEKLRCVSSIFELAMRCSASSSQKRLDMIQVVAALHKIKFPVEEV